MKLFKTVSTCLISIVEKTTNRVEDVLDIGEDIFAAGKALSRDFREDTEFECAKNTATRNAELAEWEATLNALTEATDE